VIKNFIVFQYWMVECRSTVVAVFYNDNTKLCTDVTVYRMWRSLLKKYFTR